MAINKPRLKIKYETEVQKALAAEFGIGNYLALPRIVKVVVNAGIGEIAKNKEQLESTQKDLALLTGQKPSIRKAKISVASFGVRKGVPVGLKVTLRGSKMYDFLDRLFSIVLPRLRDFRGLAVKSLDKDGNYTIGFVDHTVFPEIDQTKTTKVFGLEITIVTSTKKGEEAKRLLELLGMPFAKDKDNLS